MKTAAERLREVRAVKGETCSIQIVTGRDLRTFRQGMYHAEMDGDGFFVFEGERYDARAIHWQTQDRVKDIEAIIIAKRVGQ